MKLTMTIIEAVADSFPSVEALQEAKDAAVQAMLQNPDQIVTAATGAGASYTKRINATPAELVELYALALRVKKGEPIESSMTQVNHTMVFWPF